MKTSAFVSAIGIGVTGILASMISAGSARAESPQEIFGGVPDQISFEDLRASCQASKDDSGKSGGGGVVRQYPVKHPVIRCVDTFTTWVEDGSKKGSLL